MKRMFLNMEKAQKLAELTENWQIWRTKSCHGLTDEEVAQFQATRPTIFSPMADDFKVAQFGG